MLFASGRKGRDAQAPSDPPEVAKVRVPWTIDVSLHLGDVTRELAEMPAETLAGHSPEGVRSQTALPDALAEDQAEEKSDPRAKYARGQTQTPVAE
jgi:hypothetical protein